ncbi:MAG: hypothetical protein H7343_15405 [Undibacterium sp.]|nr:hypothetical protein [Opitutaceae bacterium]
MLFRRERRGPVLDGKQLDIIARIHEVGGVGLSGFRSSTAYPSKAIECSVAASCTRAGSWRAARSANVSATAARGTTK